MIQIPNPNVGAVQAIPRDPVDVIFAAPFSPTCVDNPDLSELRKAYLDAIERGQMEGFARGVQHDVAEALDEKFDVSRSIVWVRDGTHGLRLILWEDHSLPHSLLHTTVTREIIMSITVKGGTKLSNALVHSDDTRVTLYAANSEVHKEADAAIMAGEKAPKLGAEDLAATIVFEGAVAHEDHEMLCRELLLWHRSPKVKAAFGVKAEVSVSSEDQSAPVPLVLYCAEKVGDTILFKRPHAFGCGTSCLHPNSPGHTLHIPLKLIFADTSLERKKVVQEETIEIALFQLRDGVYTHLNLDSSAVDRDMDTHLDKATQALEKVIRDANEAGTFCEMEALNMTRGSPRCMLTLGNSSLEEESSLSDEAEKGST